MISITFDGSFDGFLSVVYAVYYEKIQPASIQDESNGQLTLDATPQFIKTDEARAARVFKAIREKISEEAADNVFNAFLSEDANRYSAILSYIRLGFKVGHMVDSHLHEDFVRHVRKLANNVVREAHLLYGFCRFAETTQKVYYCKVTPKNDVLQLLAAFFCERMMNQAWVIHDAVRNKAAVYDGNSYVIAAVPSGQAAVSHAPGESETQEMWVAFFNAITIDARRNPKLQRKILPLHYRHNMTEFLP
ncbi:MAG: TIGR03915 family putative DNA repair protein [Defluviitaleaceae bacterium]|nr:TIGR03915 family putative DNA repair protein [Defluviitaleaceae bacterium]